jgi:hypothetical protein
MKQRFEKKNRFTESRLRVCETCAIDDRVRDVFRRLLRRLASSAPAEPCTGSQIIQFF